MFDRVKQSGMGSGTASPISTTMRAVCQSVGLFVKEKGVDFPGYDLFNLTIDRMPRPGAATVLSLKLDA